MTKILKTNNETWGFYGTMSIAGENADQAWTIAMTAIQAATAGSAEAVRLFLDSRDGRHFADQVCGGFHKGTLAERIIGAVGDYQNWKISQGMSRTYGIPAGLPYLTAWVCHYEHAHDHN
jgi:hypothetical protein